MKKLVEKAAKGIGRQVRRGLAVPNQQGQPDIDAMLERWSKGFQQNLNGSSLDRFTESFLGLFDENLRKSIEADIKQLHGVAKFDRFRRKVLVSFAVAYYNGALAQKSGNNVDIPQMVKDAVRENLKAEGFDDPA